MRPSTQIVPTTQTSISGNQSTLRTSTKPYERSTPRNCYKCGKPSHHSNICPENWSIILEGDIAEGSVENEEDRDYDKAEYAQKDDVQVSCE